LPKSVKSFLNVLVTLAIYLLSYLRSMVVTSGECNASQLIAVIQ